MTRGRSISTLPPWKPTFPWSCPSGAHPFRRRGRSGHRTPWVASSSSMLAKVARPVVRQKRVEARANLLPGIFDDCRRDNSGRCGRFLHGVAFLSLDCQHPEPTGSRRATPHLTFSTAVGTSEHADIGPRCWHPPAFHPQKDRVRGSQVAEFYSARGWEIPPLPWTNLSPPFSAIRPLFVFLVGAARPLVYRLDNLASGYRHHTAPLHSIAATNTTLRAPRVQARSMCAHIARSTAKWIGSNQSRTVPLGYARLIA